MANTGTSRGGIRLQLSNFMQIFASGNGRTVYYVLQQDVFVDVEELSILLAITCIVGLNVGVANKWFLTKKSASASRYSFETFSRSSHGIHGVDQATFGFTQLVNISII